MNPTYNSKYNLHHESQIIPLMIPNGKGWHYFAVKELLALLKEILLKRDGDFYCLNCLYSFRTKNRFESHKKVCENKYFRGVTMPFHDTKIITKTLRYHLLYMQILNL